MENPDKSTKGEQGLNAETGESGIAKSSMAADQAKPKANRMRRFYFVVSVVLLALAAAQIYNEREYWGTVLSERKLFPKTESAHYVRIRNHDGTNLSATRVLPPSDAPVSTDEVEKSREASP